MKPLAWYPRRTGTAVLCALFAVAAAAQTVKVFHPDVPTLSYEVATIKPQDPSGHLFGGTTREYIMDAYNAGVDSFGVRPVQVLGGPDWIDKDHYIITGRPSDEVRQAMQTMTRGERLMQTRTMDQSLLAERFHLKVHFETREMPVYALVPAKGGLKIKPVEPPPLVPAVLFPRADGTMPPGAFMIRSGTNDSLTITAHATTMERLIYQLRQQGRELGGRPIIDRTGFVGPFDIDHLQWANSALGDTLQGKSADSDAPSVSTALEQDLGLKLVATRGQVEVVVIDSIDRPTEN